MNVQSCVVVNSINAKFKSSNADSHELNKELNTFHRSLRSRLRTPLGEERKIKSCDFGYKFVSECEKYLMNFSKDKKEAEVRRVAATKERFHKKLCIKLKIACLALRTCLLD